MYHGNITGDNMTEAQIKMTKVIKQDDFFKHSGGFAGMQKQRRTLKIHENGWMSYYKGQEMKGFFRIGAATKVGIAPGHPDWWELTTEDRKTNGEDKIKSRKFVFSETMNHAKCLEWVKEVKAIAEKFAASEN